MINLIGNFGTVFLDNSYFNKAIATSPAHALPGYVMGGLSWFAVPWVTATCMGLAGLALEGYDVWPTYPERLADADVTAGLVLPNVAVAMLGKGGAVATVMLAVSLSAFAPAMRSHNTNMFIVYGYHEHLFFGAHLDIFHLSLRHLQDQCIDVIRDKGRLDASVKGIDDHSDREQEHGSCRGSACKELDHSSTACEKHCCDEDVGEAAEDDEHAMGDRPISGFHNFEECVSVGSSPF